MGNFLVRYVSRVIIYDRKMFKRLATGPTAGVSLVEHENLVAG